MGDLFAITEEINALFKRVDEFLYEDKNGQTCVKKDAPAWVDDEYKRLKELGKKETELLVRYGIQI